MTRRFAPIVSTIFMVGIITPCGCSIPQMSIEKMKAMKPARAAELDQLEMFAGQWRSEIEINFTFLDKPLTGTGMQNVAWECDRTVMLNRGQYDVAELGRMAGLESWSWDGKAGKFRLRWMDNWGYTGEGTGTYDAATMTWHIKAIGADSKGHRTVAEGTIVFKDANTMEWHWIDWTWGKLFKIGEFKGTNRRV